MVGTFEQNDGLSKVHDEDHVQSEGSGGVTFLRACAHAAPLAGDHTTARSGTLWRNILRLMLARAKSVKAIHSSEYNTDLECLGGGGDGGACPPASQFCCIYNYIHLIDSAAKQLKAECIVRACFCLVFEPSTCNSRET